MKRTLLFLFCLAAATVARADNYLIPRQVTGGGQPTHKWTPTDKVVLVGKSDGTIESRVLTAVDISGLTAALDLKGAITDQTFVRPKFGSGSFLSQTVTNGGAVFGMNARAHASTAGLIERAGVGAAMGLVADASGLYAFGNTSSGASGDTLLSNADNSQQIFRLHPNGFRAHGAWPGGTDSRFTIEYGGDFRAFCLKPTGANTDLNVQGGVMVSHSATYSGTSGYADTTQFYSLAGSKGTIIGNNNFVGATTPYAPTLSDVPNGWIRFELGPLWPKSEKMRINPAEVLIGMTLVRDIDATPGATQSGTTVTAAEGSFTGADVGRYIAWSDYTNGGTEAAVDRITAVTNGTTVTVETSRTIATAQAARVVSFTIKLNQDGTITGSGTGIANINGSNIASGTVPADRLGSGGAAGKFLRYDNTWVTVAGTGDVTAAAAFGTDNRLVRSDGTGKGVQASGIAVDDSDNLAGVGTIESADIDVTGSVIATDGFTGSAVRLNTSGFDGTIQSTNLTADRAFQVPNADGTFALISGDLGTPSVVNLTNATSIPAGQLTGTVANARLTSAVRSSAFGVDIDGGGSAITTGEKGVPVRFDYACTITGWTLTADQSGSLVIDVWKEASAFDGGGVLTNPPTVADTITASAKPTLSSQRGKTSTTLTGWTTSIAAGDTVTFNVDSASTITRAKLIIHVQK